MNGRGRIVAALLLVPPGLSLLVLAAHFLRGGDLSPMLLCVGLLGLLFVRRPWATRVLQIALVLGAVEWIRTGIDLVSARQASGEPFERMATILEVVAWVTFLSALLFELPPLRRRDGRIRPTS